MTDLETTRQVESVLRSIASAGKALRLYPASSSIPRQSVEAAVAEIAGFLDSYPVLALSVGRDGFQWSGSALGIAAPGVLDLAEELRLHGVAEVDFLPGCTTDDLTTFLETIGRERDDVLAEGGPGAALVAAGVEGIRVTDVHLTVVEQVTPEADQDIEEFLRGLAFDADKLAAWLAAASAGDASTFEEGLTELSQSVGVDGVPQLARTLAEAFLKQDTGGKDALLGLALEPGMVRELAGSMFGHLGSVDIAAALCEGLFGSNMLSLSNALTNLPLEERLRQVYADVQGLLPQCGHTDKEVAFLQHMMAIRSRTAPEVPLVDADTTYRRVAAAVDVTEEEIASLRSQTSASAGHSASSGVRIMLALLDQQQDFALYAEGIDHLAAMVPRLVENGDVDLALVVVGELAARESRAVQPWPELSERLRQALAAALGRETMGALVAAAIADRSRIATVREFLRYADESAIRALAEEAIARKREGLEVASAVLGKRLVDVLVPAATTAQWFQLAPIVERLAAEDDPRAQRAIETLLARSDEQSRRETAQGLAAGGGAAASRLLARLMRDPSPEVAMIAVRAVAKHDMPSGSVVLGERLAELDIDNKDFLLAREIIGALARLSDPGAGDVLDRLASRKALIKRGHFAEVQELVRQARAVRSQRTGGAG